MLIGDLHWAIPLFHETTIKDEAGFGFWGFLITVIHMINASKILSELELFMIFLFNLSRHKMEDTLKHSEKNSCIFKYRCFDPQITQLPAK